jgi:hypothetical protein
VTQQSWVLSQQLAPQQICVVPHACPAHVFTQWPMAHVGLEPLHFVAQSPQWSGLLFKSTHVSPQHALARPVQKMGQPASVLPPLDEPLPDPEPELDPELDPELEPELEPELDADPELDPDPEPDPEPEPELPPLLEPWPPLLDPDPLLLEP